MLLYFLSKSSTISMILFRNVSLSRSKSTTRFGVSRFFQGKLTIPIGRETKTHILLTKINDKNSLRPALLSISILLEQYNHSTTPTTLRTHFGSRAIVDRVSPCSSVDCGWERKVWVFSLFLQWQTLRCRFQPFLRFREPLFRRVGTRRTPEPLWLCWFCRG